MKTLLALALASIASCSLVSVPEPVGEPLSPRDLNEFVGDWLIGESHSYIHVERLNDTQLLVAPYALREGRGWELDDEVVEPVELRQIGRDLIFAFTRFPLKDLPEGEFAWPFVTVQIHDDQLLLRWPNANTFAEWVDSGQLTGSVIRKDYSLDVRLDTLTEEQIDFITSPANLPRMIDTSEFAVGLRIDPKDLAAIEAAQLRDSATPAALPDER
jgi:hypothetical protein